MILRNVLVILFKISITIEQAHFENKLQLSQLNCKVHKSTATPIYEKKKQQLINTSIQLVINYHINPFKNTQTNL